MNFDDDLVRQADDALAVMADRTVRGTDPVGTGGLRDPCVSVLYDQEVGAVFRADLHTDILGKRIFRIQLTVDEDTDRISRLPGQKQTERSSCSQTKQNGNEQDA